MNIMSEPRAVSRDKTRIRLGLLLLVASLIVSSCAATYHSGCSGTLSAGKIAATDLVVPQGCRSVVLTGTVTLESGRVSVVLAWPGDGTKTFAFTHEATGGNQAFVVGPFEQTAQGGIWTLSVEGEEGATGAYELALDAN
jgi:hypothetical protein